VARYATFLNRAFDQVLMDCALHRAGVTFVLDRAGVTGDDGASHNGMWDMAMLQVVPGLRLAAPRDEATLRAELREAVAVDDAPTVVRFPKGALGPVIPALRVEAGYDVLAESGAPEVVIVSVGAFASLCIDVAERLRAQGIGVIVVDPRWVKPVPESLAPLAARARLVVVVEDGVRTGGVGSAVSQLLRDSGVEVAMRSIGVPARFLEHGKRAEVLAECGLTAQDISRSIVEMVALRTDAAPSTSEISQ
jgi:1-deoxy-D-xylulose-5-phosphate synthase